jgi:hypothetical protein
MPWAEIHWIAGCACGISKMLHVGSRVNVQLILVHFLRKIRREQKGDQPVRVGMWRLLADKHRLSNSTTSLDF